MTSEWVVSAWRYPPERVDTFRNEILDSFIITHKVPAEALRPPLVFGYFVDVELLADREDIVDCPVDDQTGRKRYKEESEEDRQK